MVQEGQPPAERCRRQPEQQHQSRAAARRSAPPREQLMSVTADERPDAVVLAVHGAVDGLTAPRLRDAIRDAFARSGGRVLVVDLAGVDFLGSPGLHALITSAREAAQHGGHQPLRIAVDPTRPAVRSIARSGLDGVLALYDDVADALRGG